MVAFTGTSATRWMQCAMGPVAVLHGVGLLYSFSTSLAGAE